MHSNSKLLFEKYALDYFKNSVKVLEIGPDKIPSVFEETIENKSIQWDTLNLEIGEETSRARNDEQTFISRHEYNYPIPDNTYDIILSCNVLEHVKKFWLWFDELKRIVKPGGHIITISPISWPYHEAPVDCWRIYPEGMRAIYEDKDLTDIFTTFESLESKNYEMTNTPLYPWASTGNESKIKIINTYNKILGFIPFTKIFRVPLSVSYDLISIARLDTNTPIIPE